MLKHRLIPVLLLRNGIMVQSKGFKRYQRLGDPTTVVQRMSDWVSDELIYLDISREQSYDLGRDDLGAENRGSLLDILDDISRCCFMPLAFGGGIRTVEDAAVRIQRGADKIVVNTQPLRDPGFVEVCAREFGSQAVVISMDARRVEGGYEVFLDSGRDPTGRDPAAWAQEVESRGAGEILINSIDEDGRGQGYDLDLVSRVANAVQIPVIALGGVSEWSHFEAGIAAGADAVAAANIFNYSENSVFKAKRHLHAAGLNFREPRLGDVVAGEGAQP